MLKGAGVECILQSYFTLGKAAPANKEFDYYMLDSGGYSARVRGIEIDVREYASYLKKHQIKYAFNLDTSSVPETLRNQKYLEDNTDTYIIPIYHTSDWLDPQYRDLLEKYCASYPFIGLGGMAGVGLDKATHRKFLNFCFSHTKDKTKVHGLGMTSNILLKTYPFFSVDSTSWQRSARFATSRIYSNDMAKVRARKRHFLENMEEEAKYWIKTQEEITDLWKRRGITWNNVRRENA